MVCTLGLHPIPIKVWLLSIKIYTPTSTGEGTFSSVTVYGQWPGGGYLAADGVTTAVPKPEIVYVMRL